MYTAITSTLQDDCGDFRVGYEESNNSAEPATTERELNIFFPVGEFYRLNKSCTISMPPP